MEQVPERGASAAPSPATLRLGLRALSDLRMCLGCDDAECVMCTNAIGKT